MFGLGIVSALLIIILIVMFESVIERWLRGFRELMN